MKYVKELMAEILSDWLLKDFGLLIDNPTPEDIEETLEEYEE
jgi:hypothetical protein